MPRSCLPSCTRTVSPLSFSSNFVRVELLVRDSPRGLLACRDSVRADTKAEGRITVSAYTSQGGWNRICLLLESADPDCAAASQTRGTRRRAKCASCPAIGPTIGCLLACVTDPRPRARCVSFVSRRVQA